MLGAATRTSLRTSAPRCILRHNLSRRLVSSTPPAQRSRSWKSSAARWGLGIGGLWYYTTSSVFAEERPYAALHPQAQDDDTSNTQTVDQLADARKERRSLLRESAPIPAPLDSPSPSTSPDLSMAASSAALSASGVSPAQPQPQPTAAGSSSLSAPTEAASPEDLEDEAGEQGAFNEETGEINWDCPCLGGMAHGPCGPEFREAFGCFVYSKEEPKGVDCIDRFKGMQECFKLHPDVYGAELAEDAEEEEEAAAGAAAAAAEPAAAPATYSGTESSVSRVPDQSVSSVTPSTSLTSSAGRSSTTPPTAASSDSEGAKTQRAQAATSQVKTSTVDDSEGGKEIVPKAWRDARDADEQTAK
ncbi:MAG: Oxidoreductase [Chrysothrix sp. TS-e1954]|nr:MAG: Oxidoreductase [Chrysothrix sp. TS-e1954]